jgi:hypothetical protein
MKARLENNEIKLYDSIPNSFLADGETIAGGGKNLSDEKLKEYGFFDVVIPSHDIIIEKLSDIYFDDKAKVFTYDVVEIKFAQSLSALKESKIREIKQLAYQQLLKTDWAIVRKAETGDDVPLSIAAERAYIRNTTNDKEAEVNALSTKKEVLTYNI